jgi:hypothetical protein
MKSKKYLIAFAFAGAVVLSGFHAKEDPEFLVRLKEQLSRFTSSYPEEKIYVQFDKPFYKPQEEIWFNATVLNSNTHRPATTSDVLYLELIDPKGNVVSKQEALVTEGTAHGSFELLDSAPGGIYKVKGYTRWMKNFGSDNFFTKELTIQRVITPRMLLKLDYEKESYGPGENVKAKLSIRNLKNQKVNDATVRLIIRVAGKQVGELKLTSNDEGEANLNFVLPGDLTTTDGLLVAVVASDGVEESLSRSIPIILNNIDLQFFPEGGQWVENVSSTIAFKALNEFGKGADVKGSIVDEQDNLVTTFESFHMGMGAFELKPVAGKKYFAQITSPVQRKDRVPLPDPSKDGVSFRLAQQKKSTTEWIVDAPAKSEYFIVAQVHGEIVHSSSHDVGRGSNRIKIETSGFPSGIAVFTLFDNIGVPQCERLLFVQPEKGLVISVRPEKEFYEPGERVKIKVETKDYTGKPVRAKLSMAVADDQIISFADDKQDNILSYFMLSSEVKGDIQEPSFYFDPEEPKAKKALDYLLMTQGWRRFSWSDLYKERSITYAPEKLTTISGRVIDRNNDGLEQEVTYIETGNRKRVAQVKSTKEGYFVIRNIDPSTEILLMTKKPGEIIIEKSKTMVIEQLTDDPVAARYNENAEVTRDATEVAQAKEESPAKDVEKNATVEGGDLDLDMDSDVAQLSEVVVVGYGAEERKSIVGAITSVNSAELAGGFTLPSVESALQGRAAGITVTTSGNPGAMGNIRIRGMSSLASGRSEPLYVINGHPMASALNGNFSNGSMIAPEDIESIQIMPSPEATAIFGAAGSNGAIMINTRNKLNYQHSNFGYRERKPKYNTFTVIPRIFSPTREFYAPPANSSKERDDFRTTVHWVHTLVTDDKGIAEVSFHASDAVSAFRITTEGFSGNGLIGRNESVYSTQLPVSIDTKIPQALGFEDVLKLPVMIKNERPAKMSGVIAIELPSALSINEPTHVDVEVPPGETKTIWYTIRPKGIQGTFPIVINTAFAGAKDQIKHDIIVRSVGFPREFSVSAKEVDNTFNVSIQDAEDKSIHAQLNVFPDVLSDLFEGAESILREPHGCFEQVSSSTFPNILALQFMKESGKITPEIEKKALDYIRTGYRMLAGYEIRSGGFEWFGHPPAHEGLTGYGLIEFYEMAKVYSGVDQAMVTRTREWLLSRRDGKGGFKQSDQGYDSFSGSSGSVGNAYILYALSETGKDNVSIEYTTAASEAWKSKDMYRLALMANTAYNLGKDEDYRKFVSYFEQHISAEGIAVLNAQESMVHSYGNSLRTETLALWTLALLKDIKAYQPLIVACINELVTYRSFGGFGSTQGTVLALKVLAEYAKWTASAKEDGIVEVVINDKVADRLAFTKDARGTLSASAFTNALSSGNEHAIRVKFVGSSSALPYSVNIKWYTRTPLSDPACHLDLETVIDQPVVRVNETVRMNVTIKNKSAKGLPMAIAIIGIPAGLSLQPWQLKEMQEKGVFDFYEITNGNLVVYYRSVGASATNVIDLDLKADVPGEYKATASSACLYYANEFKDWEAGTKVKIVPAM